jgi:hypothetical protein
VRRALFYRPVETKRGSLGVIGGFALAIGLEHPRPSVRWIYRIEQFDSGQLVEKPIAIPPPQVVRRRRWSVEAANVQFANLGAMFGIEPEPGMRRFAQHPSERRIRQRRVASGVASTHVGMIAGEPHLLHCVVAVTPSRHLEDARRSWSDTACRTFSTPQLCRNAGKLCG